MPLSSADTGIVSNLRQEYGDKIKEYQDEIIAQAWRDFSQSTEYPDKDCKFFPSWCEAYDDAHLKGI